MIRTLLLLTALSLIGGCDRCSSRDNNPPQEGTKPAASAANATIHVNGSTTLYPAVKEGAARFMAHHQGAEIVVARSSSGNGIKQLIAGTCEIATVAREPKPREFEAAEKQGVTLKAYQVAYDALAIVVHPSKHEVVKSLTRSQVRGIFFDGSITDWSAVDTSLSGAIKVFVRDQKTSGAAETFTEHITDTNATPYVNGAVLLEITTEMAKSVAREPNGIAFTPFSFVDDSVRAVDYGKDADSLVAASLETIRGLRYPLRRDLFLVTNGTPKGTINQLVQFMLGAEGQAAVEAAGLTSLH